MDPSTMNEYAIGMAMLVVVLLIIAWRQGILGESLRTMYFDGGGLAVAICIFLAGIGVWHFQHLGPLAFILMGSGITLGLITWQIDRKTRQKKELQPKGTPGK